MCSNDGDSAPRAEHLEPPRKKRLGYEKRERIRVGFIWTCKSSDELINISKVVQNLLTADSEFDNMETTNDHTMGSSDDHMDRKLIK